MVCQLIHHGADTGKPFWTARILSTSSQVSWLPPSTQAGPDICVLLDIFGITMTAGGAGIHAMATTPATEVVRAGLCFQTRVTAYVTSRL